MRRYRKLDHPVDDVRRFLAPGPIGGTMISSGNHSFELIRRSRQCVNNLPIVELLDSVVAIGNCSGAEHALPRRWAVHAVRRRSLASPSVQAGNAVMVRMTLQECAG